MNAFQYFKYLGEMRGEAKSVPVAADRGTVK